jgi:hypothetical protein
MSINNSQQGISSDNVSFGNVYIMTHSIFSHVIKIGCTTSDTEQYAKLLSAKTPGHYELFFSLSCDNPCQVKKQIRNQFDAKKFVNEFYEVSPETAKNVLKREIMKIPVVSIYH